MFRALYTGKAVFVLHKHNYHHLWLLLGHYNVSTTQSTAKTPNFWLFFLILPTQVLMEANFCL